MGVLQRLAFVVCLFSFISLLWAATQPDMADFAAGAAGWFVWSLIACALVWVLRGSWKK